ncbi:hypothetical protein M2338_002932 [Sphingobium sp. B2D3B]|uniref:phage antirepressor N-terminal domain-containing protein n=1 Tax=Sphingobium sp. B2D3B TaxID=2940580 RepID=UPI002225516E|nr:phage antirepressor N-terminal domain-containing protein [Sphingobium sp. B2D3B]MCW2383367.1 hypothetical protein [Sphingobium sp. B2D3B]
MSIHQRFEIVPFNDHHILTVRNDHGVHVVMKPIVEALGLDWSSQHKRISRHPVLAEGMVITTIPSVNGKQDVAVLELECFHGWLVTISPDRITDDDKRALIIEYQRRAFRVIFEHFHGPIRQAEPAYSPVRDLIALQNQAMRLSARLQRTSNAADRRMVHAMLAGLCGQIGIETPPLDQLGSDAPTAPDQLRAFWHGLETLAGLGVDVNHSRRADLLAVSLPELKALFRAHGIGVEIDKLLRESMRLSERPRFMAIKSVNSRLLPKAVSCWVFLKSAAALPEPT